jgi:hypothetical protein
MDLHCLLQGQRHLFLFTLHVFTVYLLVGPHVYFQWSISENMAKSEKKYTFLGDYRVVILRPGGGGRLRNAACFLELRYHTRFLDLKLH